MPLQVAEGSVVGEDVEAIACPLECPCGFVSTILPFAGVGPKHAGAIGRRHPTGDRHQLVVRQIGNRIQRRRHNLDLAVGIELSEGDFVARRRFSPVHPVLGRACKHSTGLRQILDPPPATGGLIDSGEERGNDLAQLGQHEVRMRAHLFDRVGEHSQEERFERLTSAEEADIRRGRRRQESTKRVERFRADHRSINAVRIGWRLGILRAEVRLHRRNPSRIGLERVIHHPGELGCERRPCDFGRHVILPAPVRPIRVGDISRGLFEVGHQATPLEDLGQNIGGAFAGDVDAAQLCDRIVSVLVEDARIQPVGAVGADGRESRLVKGLNVAPKLVQKEAPQRLGRSRVAREHRALDRFGQVDQREDRPIGVGEIRSQRLLFVAAEGVLCFGGELHDGQVFYLPCPTTVFRSAIGWSSDSATAIRWAMRTTRSTSRISSSVD